MILRILPLLIAFAVPAQSATYFVDPDSGSNSSVGTSSSTPWESPPGTRNAVDTAFVSTTWEAGASDISTASKVLCGDTILLKGGTTHGSDDGGAWRIDGNFYASSCTAASPITIRVATGGEWSESAGDFTFDATGIEDTGTTFGGTTQGVVAVEIGGIAIGGASQSQRLRVISVSGESAVTANNSSGRSEDNTFRYIFTEGGTHGFSTTNQNRLIVNDLETNNSGGAGIQFGYNVDHETRDSAFKNITVTNCGLTTESPFVRADCIFGDALNNVWFENVTIAHGGMRGINVGEIAGVGGYDGDHFAHFRGFNIYDMGRRCQVVYGEQDCPNGSGCVSCVGAGIEVSGADDVPQVHRWVFLRGVLYQNSTLGFGGYEDTFAELHHGTLFGNGYWNPGGSDIVYDRTTGGIGVFNSIVDRRSYSRRPWGVNNAGIGVEDPHPYSMGTVYKAAATLTEEFSGFNHVTSFDGNPRTYTEALSSGHGFSTADTFQTAAIGFSSIGGDCDTDGNLDVGDCDFALAPGSVAIDHGLCAFTTSDTGSNSTGPIALTPASVLHADPRLYFVSPDTYRGAIGDTIRVGDDTVTITAAGASTVTVSPAITWADGECVHWAYAGAAPDAGAFEFVPGTTSAGDWTDDMLAVWRLDEASGSRLNAQGSATFDLGDSASTGNDTTNTQEGVAAASFEGATYLAVDADGVAAPALPITWGCWARDTITDEGFGALVLGSWTWGAGGFYIDFIDAVQRYRAVAFDGANFTVAQVGGSNSTHGTYSHVVGQIPDAGTVRLFVNGSQSGTDETGTDIYAAPTCGTFRIGGGQPGLGSFEGQIDECFIDDSALAAAAICRICSCGLDGSLCTCNGGAYANEGRNDSDCEDCDLSGVACNASSPN